MEELKININLLRKFLYFIFLIGVISTHFLVKEPQELIAERIKWYGEKSDQITKGLLDYTLLPGKGMSCVAKKQIPSKEFIHYIPEEYVISGCNLLKIKF
jgi:hypothetical protein